jgi:hypothetical protein
MLGITKMGGLKYSVFSGIFLRRLHKEIKYLDCDQGKCSQNDTSHALLLLLKAEDKKQS